MKRLLPNGQLSIGAGKKVSDFWNSTQTGEKLSEKQILTVLDYYSLFWYMLVSWFRDKFGKELPNGCIPKGQNSAVLSPTCLGDKLPLRKVEKPVYFTSKVLTNMEKWIILKNGTSHCSEEMANSDRVLFVRCSSVSYQTLLVLENATAQTLVGHGCEFHVLF